MLNREPIWLDRLKRSPWTDPASLGGSAIFHMTLLVLASLLVIRAAFPTVNSKPRVVHAELGPIENRVPAQAGGGAPGELGGQGQVELVNVLPGVSPRSSEDVGEALIAEAVPPELRADAPLSDLPGIPSTGVGVLPGPGSGGGGGTGGGSGGGEGRGFGPSTEFFGAREKGSSFAYVIDCSGSMLQNGALTTAKRELLASLGQLPPDARFSVIFYNLEPTEIGDAAGHMGLMPATSRNKEWVRSRLGQMHALGGTNHVRALEAAFAQKPEVIFFLTDARHMTTEQAEDLEKKAGEIRIQAIEFGPGPDPRTYNPLRELAIAAGGSYRYIDVTRYVPGR